MKKKRLAGVLSFSDVARLAVDALVQDLELRQFYKENTELIMIDEFQDNNELQRDLLFLIAEKIGRKEKSVPSAEYLCSDKLFFVGDEKQSIYAFRGADVSVFRMLSNDISSNEQPENTRLPVNYRTNPALIHLFNRIFNKVFYSDVNKPLVNNGLVPAYEAEYYAVNHSELILNGLNSKLEIMIADKNRFTGECESRDYFSPIETEAFALAKRIREMYDGKMLIRNKDNAEPCSWSSFAVLLRTTSHQSVYERVFRAAGIPYKSLQQKGLFNYAPINDLYAVLKLAVYPSDKKTYAQILRGPFVNIDDSVFPILVLPFSEPFVIELSEKLTGENKKAYINACHLFRRLKQNIRTMNCAELVTYLWYDEGYRYLFFSNKEDLRYLEMYDYLFELARQADLKSFTVSQFVDMLASYIEDGEKLNDMDLPFEYSKDAVSFLTVHKSKGLEFPIVCIPGCGNRGSIEKKRGLMFFDKTFGPVIHAPQVSKYTVRHTVSGDELYNFSDQKNMIFENLKEETNLKLLAETKRLLYVAMTRAESYLIMSAVMDKLDNKKFETDNEHSLSQIKEALIQPKESLNKSFFDLLLPVLPENDSAIVFTEIMPVKRTVLLDSKEKYESFNLQTAYKNAQVKEFNLADKKIIAATTHSKGEYKQSEESVQSFSEPPFFLTENRVGLESFSPAQLGTIAHAAIEARFLKRHFTYPSDTEKKIKPWVETFFSSELYALAETSENIKCEYGFLTEYDGQTISGQIDLLFKKDSTVYIIDYKTDTVEYPERHALQLAIYKKAVFDLALIEMKKNGIADNFDLSDKVQVKAFVFYLKTGHYFEL